jgi:hypothetical protein
VVEGDESPKIIEQSILEYCKHLSTMTDYQGALEFIRNVIMKLNLEILLIQILN